MAIESAGGSRTQKGHKGRSYITPEGFQKLQAEFDELWHVERPRVTQEVSEAAALGDRSENAEYIYGKRRLRQIDARLRYLSRRMDALTVWQPSDARQGQAFFGAWVTLLDEDDVQTRYRLVGADEFDVKRNLISVDSPVGRALLGRRVGDEVAVRRPKGTAHYEIIAIDYPGPDCAR